MTAVIDTADRRMELRPTIDSTLDIDWEPPVFARHRRILDVGCGTGATLRAIAQHHEARCVGVDCDAAAIAAGSAHALPNMQLIHASAESLPFRSNSFDLVFARATAPYCDVDRALGEMARVLDVHGHLWLLLHGPAALAERFSGALREIQVRELAFCGYVALNSVALATFGRDFPIGRWRESVQTERGMRRALAKLGIGCTSVTRGARFAIHGLKLACPGSRDDRRD